MPSASAAAGILAAFLLALASGSAVRATDPVYPPVPPQVEALTDIAYARRGGEQELRLDLYRPRSDHPPRPLVVWIHGGGFIEGNKSQCVNPMFMTGWNLAVASIDYRLSTAAPFPAQLQDCKDAIRFLRQHAQQYGLDAGHRYAARGRANLLRAGRRLDASHG